MIPALSCPACREALPEYVAQTLSPLLAAQVEIHLASCAACCEEWAAIRDLATLIGRPFPGDTPAPDVVVRVLAQVHAQVPAADSVYSSQKHQTTPDRIPLRERARPPQVPSRHGWFFPMLLVALLVVLATVVFSRPHLPSSMASRVAPLTAAQLRGMELRAVAFATPDEGWAGGNSLPESRQAQSGTPYVSPVLIHYLGGLWSADPLPPALAQASVTISALRLLSPSEGWAIAHSQLPPNADGALTSELLHLHAGQWTVSGSPFPTTLTQLAFASPNDGWAVGMDTGSPREALVLHYDGASWHTVHDPTFAALSLSAVAASPDHTVWAAGVATQGVGSDGIAATVLITFDGAHWSRQTLPTQDATAHISALAFTSATTGWAVGVLPRPVSPSGAGTAPIPDQAVILRYQQGAWQEALRIAGAAGPTASSFFSWYDLSLSGPTEGWVVGSAGAMVHLTTTGPHLLAPAPQSLDLLGVDLLSATEGWAVGTRGTLLHLMQGQWRIYRP